MVTFSEASAATIDKLGIAGVGLAVFLNGLSVPGTSEVLLPLSGVAVSQGKLELGPLLAVAMIGQLLGSSVAYAIARYGGIALVKRYGKYVLISNDELDAAQRAFDKYGARVVIFGSIVPGLQGVLGYIAGVTQMNYARFLASLFVGKTVWIVGLVYVGMVLGDHIALIDRIIKQVGVVVLAGLVILGFLYVRRHRRNNRKPPAASEENK
jgi:membrane protein DedA with SNARE-associated domain